MAATVLQAERRSAVTAAAGFRRDGGVLVVRRRLLEEAATRFGTPLYVYSGAMRGAAYEAYDRAFAPVPHRICYALKANGSGRAPAHPGLAWGRGRTSCRGSSCEAALRAGFPAERIVFSGVGKTDDEIARGVEAGIGEFNAESEEELAAHQPRRLRAGPHRPRDAAVQPRHRPALARLHLHRPPREQVRCRHRASPPPSWTGPAASRASRSRACSATSAPR